MKKLIILFLLVSLNAFGWTWVDPDGDSPYGSTGDGKLCGEYGKYYVNNSFTNSSIDIVNFAGVWIGSKTNEFAFKNDGSITINNAIKNAAAYWNEAGSEHLLVHGTDGVFIRLIYSSDSYAARTYYDWWPTGDCSEDEEQRIDVNERKYRDAGESLYFSGVMTHEFGHILGLGHTNENKYENTVNNSCSTQNGTSCFFNSDDIMMSTYFYDETHLTEDDKYGVRELYGKDDKSIRYVMGFNNNAINKIALTMLDSTVYNSDSTHKTYVKPQINYIPNTSYKYLLTWVKSSSHKIYFEIVNAIPANAQLLNHFGPFEVNTEYDILTAPSVAINSNGTEALVVFQNITENKVIRLQEDIYFFKINLTNGSYTVPQKIVYASNTITTSNIKSMGSPLVMWSNNISRWIIFWQSRDYGDEWSIKYIVSNNSSPDTYDDWNETNIKSFGNGLKAYWNPMTGNCKIVDSTNNEMCTLYFNKVYDSSLKNSVEVANFKTNTTNQYNLSFYNSYPLQDVNGNYIQNFGHLSVSSHIIDNKVANLLSVVSNATNATIKTYRLRTYDSNIMHFNPIIDPIDGELYETSSTTLPKSISGFSVSKETGSPYIFVYIEE